MHCFIPNYQATPDRISGVANLMRGESIKMGHPCFVARVQSANGLHLFTYNRENADGPIYDKEEPITTIEVHTSSTTFTTIP